MSVQAEPRQRWETSQRAVETFARTVAIGGLSGFVAGLIAGGVGSRLAMRVSGILTEPAFRSVLTENDNVVGEITVGGTAILILVAGFFGAAGGLLYVAMRPWMADAGRWRGLAFGVVLLAILGSLILEADNPDFHLFGPPGVNVAMFASIFVIFGLLLPPSERMLRALPPPSLSSWTIPLPIPAEWSVFGLGSFAVYGFGIILAIMAVSFAIHSVTVGDRASAHFLLAYGLFALPIASVLLTRITGQFRRLSDLRGRPGALLVALALFVVPVAFGTYVVARAIADIFSAA